MLIPIPVPYHIIPCMSISYHTIHSNTKASKMPKQVLDNKHIIKIIKKDTEGKEKKKERSLSSISITVIFLLTNNAFVSGAVKLRCCSL